MKIKVSFTVEIDEGLWAMEYGLSPNEVRDDVKWYCEQVARDSYAVEAFTIKETNA